MPAFPHMTLKSRSEFPHGERGAGSGAEDTCLVVLGEVPVQDLAQLNANWYESLFVALTMNAKNEVVEVHVLAREAKQLPYPQAGVQGHKGNGVRPGLITPDGLPVYKPIDLLRSESG
jgi:hypothetical protein